MNGWLYRGRFAPSPTGSLHFGSLVAAVGSYVDAHAHGGSWLLRIEDLDPPRETPGAADDILHALESCGLLWDETVVYQSQRLEAYHAALGQLLLDGHVFPCACTRKEIADSVLEPDKTPVYPGTCRDGLPPGRTTRAYRLRISDETFVFDDRIQGRVRQELAKDVGDFIVQRGDGCIAYQLAVVVDDAWQGVTDIVRGADLLDSTPRQLYLQRLLNVPTPRYAHLPLALNGQREKLSKQTLAPPITAYKEAVYEALTFLGHQPPISMRGAAPAELLAWAIANWDPAQIGKEHEVAVL
ncbi:MAG TPA: tRNA glutamyl-Q(34) synthetase GluQRS [Burkholderiales bacterium]|jgi:glutamyl-Q tRNA(Asp) synthetase|nr:tRNA glutamyl-Q(34) synthetase GluQRS [Burkholderiales bacterium]